MPKNPTPAQRRASRANGSKGHGPKTEAGKARSRFNARKHCLTGAAFVILPGESAPAYLRLLHSYLQRIQPVDRSELLLVTNIAETEWLIRRCREQFTQTMINRMQIQEQEVNARFGRPTMAVRSCLAVEYELSSTGSCKNIVQYESRLHRQRQQLLRDLKQYRADYPPIDGHILEEDDEPEPGPGGARNNEPEPELSDTEQTVCRPSAPSAPLPLPEAKAAPVPRYHWDPAATTPAGGPTSPKPAREEVKILRAAA